MNISSLESKLNKSIDTFVDEIKLQYPEGSSESVTADDINQLARQTCYVLDDFKKAILEFLK